MHIVLMNSVKFAFLVNKRLKYLLPCFLWISYISETKAQSSRNMYGREFWVTFTENLYPDTFNHLLVTPSVADTIRIYNPQLNVSAIFPVKPGIQNIVRYPKTSINFWYSTASFVPQGKGVIVTSKFGDFALQAVNTVSGSTDVATILPSQVLSTAREYLVHTGAGNTGKESQVAVIAMDQGITTVEFTAGCDLTGLGGKGNVFTRDLKYGQVFLIQALDTQNLTGTIIKVKNSCKRIAVFAGAKCARIEDKSGCIGCDVLYDQLFPSWALGTDYNVPPVPDTKSWIVSIAALYNNTNVSINGVTLPPLQKGEWVQRTLTGPAILKSDLPISVIQLMKSAGCNGAITPTSDPSMLIIAPASSGVYNASTSVFRNAAYTVNKIILVSKTFNAPSVKINGTLIPASAYQKFSNGSNYFWFGTYPINFNKTWALTSDSFFQAYQFGLANAESYASCIGASFPNFKADFSFSPSPVCNPNTPINFTANGDSLGAFTWFFGDGNSANGKSVSHVYGKTGIFKAGIVNPSTGGCTDSIAMIVKVLEGPNLGLPRDTQPCIGSVYRVDLPANKKYKYSWDNGSTALIQSFPSNRKAILTTTDTQGCVSIDTINIQYRNCNNYDLRLANVFTPNGDGYNDEWRVIYKAYKKIEVTIFNRWGEVMYAYTLPDEPDWNGMVDNKFTQCPEGSYFYRIVATDNEGGKKEISGAITLIR